jgi:hypothetical protein
MLLLPNAAESSHAQQTRNGSLLKEAVLSLNRGN